MWAIFQRKTCDIPLQVLYNQYLDWMYTTPVKGWTIATKCKNKSIVVATLTPVWDMIEEEHKRQIHPRARRVSELYNDKDICSLYFDNCHFDSSETQNLSIVLYRKIQPIIEDLIKQGVVKKRYAKTPEWRSISSTPWMRKFGQFLPISISTQVEEVPEETV